MPRAVLFDLDGTLLDTLADLAAAMNAALAGEGLPTHPAEAYRYFVGDGLDHLVRRATPADRVGGAALRARLAAGQRAHYARGWRRSTVPYPGVEALLAELAARGVATAVFSNKPDDFTRAIVASFFPGHPFAAVRGARADTPIKPDPAGAFAVARAAGVAPADWLYLGDTDTDMRCAAAAGMTAAGVSWGFRPEGELHAAGAVHVLRAPGEALALL